MDLVLNVKQIKENLTTNEKLEWELTLSSTWKQLKINPFSYKRFKIKGTFTNPLKETFKVFAFYFQDYKLFIKKVKDDEGNLIESEEAKLIDDEKYLIRYLSQVEGEHQLVIEVYLDDVLLQTFKENFFLTKGKEKRGYLKIEPLNNRNFIIDNDKTFIPLGHNLAWYASSKKTEDYRVWFKKLTKNGANFTRIWFSPRRFSFSSGKDYKDFKDRMLHAKRLDKVFDLANEYNIYFMLTLLQHGWFSEKVNPSWQYNSWNKANGGILNSPKEFFYLKEAKEAYKEQLIYIISRWGYSLDLAAWEFWNEVNWTDNFNDKIVNEWHQEMASFVKEIDPYPHLTTTSYKHLFGDGYHLNLIEFANPHSYDYFRGNVSLELSKNINELYQLYQKPILHSEIGFNWRSGHKTRKLDPLGISFKQGLWGGALGGGAGSAFSWWWDSFIEPNNLYKHYSGISKYLSDVNMVSKTYKLLKDLKIKIANKDIKVIGYYLDDRIYGYLFNKKWTYKNPLVKMTNITVEIPKLEGNYLIKLFNTTTGKIVKGAYLKTINGKLVFKTSIKEDRAFIIEKTIKELL